MHLFKEVLSKVDHGQHSWGSDCSEASQKLMELSRTLIEGAAEKGNAEALNHMGMLYVLGLPPFSLNYESAVEYFRKAVGAGNKDAHYNLALLLLQDSRTIEAQQPAKHSTAKKWDLGAPPQAQRPACIEKDTGFAMSLLEAAAEKPRGHALAMSLLGLCYMRGHDRPTNPRRAVELWNSASKQGEPESLYSLGKAFLSGVGLDNPNPITAARLFGLAADMGQEKALTALGLLRMKDNEVESAFDLVGRAAKAQFPPAQHKMAVMMSDNNFNGSSGGPKAETLGMDAYGKLHRVGEAVIPRNPGIIFRWALAAARNGSSPAKTLCAEALQKGWGREARAAAVADELEEEARELEREERIASEEAKIARKSAETSRVALENVRNSLFEELPGLSDQLPDVKRQPESAHFAASIAANKVATAKAERALAEKRKERCSAEAKAKENAKKRHGERNIAAARAALSRLQQQHASLTAAVAKRGDIFTKMSRAETQAIARAHRTERIASEARDSVLFAVEDLHSRRQTRDLLASKSVAKEEGETEEDQMSRLQEVFQSLDDDRSGFIAAEELAAALAKLGQQVTPEQCKNLLDKVDKNNDNQISFDEFCSYFRFVDLEERLRTEAASIKAKDGKQARLSLRRPLGMVLNPNGTVGTVKPDGQATAAGLSGGCRILRVGDVPVTSLEEIKAEIGARKSGGHEEVVVHFVDPKTVAKTTAASAALSAEAHAAASDASKVALLRAEEAAFLEAVRALKQARGALEADEIASIKAAAIAADVSLQEYKKTLKRRAVGKAREEAHAFEKAARDTQARASLLFERSLQRRAEAKASAKYEKDARKPAAARFLREAAQEALLSKNESTPNLKAMVQLKKLANCI
jgi:TPR repeat protein